MRAKGISKDEWEEMWDIKKSIKKHKHSGVYAICPFLNRLNKLGRYNDILSMFSFYSLLTPFPFQNIIVIKHKIIIEFVWHI